MEKLDEIDALLMLSVTTHETLVVVEPPGNRNAVIVTVSLFAASIDVNEVFPTDVIVH
jgi:hypothetical protein